jgi:predicted nucleic acid-binding protein
VAENWVLNASPLIVLTRIGHEDLLLSLADQVVVPRLVAEEIQAGPVRDPARQLLLTGRFTIIDTPPPPPELLAWDLGQGETAVLSLAWAERTWTAILDDAAARRCARSFSIPIKGTLGLVLLARQRDVIASAAEVLQLLVASGFRLDDRIIREALARTVEEPWPP